MKDYYNEGITETLDDPINAEAQKTMDPFSYRDRLTMPKLLIQVTHEKEIKGFNSCFRPWETNFSAQMIRIIG